MERLESEKINTRTITITSNGDGETESVDLSGKNILKNPRIFWGQSRAGGHPPSMPRFQGFPDELSDASPLVRKTTVIFDKGNNFKANFVLLDALEIGFVRPVKLDEHKDFRILQ